MARGNGKGKAKKGKGRNGTPAAGADKKAVPKAAAAAAPKHALVQSEKHFQAQLEHMLAASDLHDAKFKQSERYLLLIELAKQIPLTSLPILCLLAGERHDKQALRALLETHPDMDFSKYILLILAYTADPDCWGDQADTKIAEICAVIQKQLQTHDKGQVLRFLLDKRDVQNCFEVALRIGVDEIISTLFAAIKTLHMPSSFIEDINLPATLTRACELGRVDIATFCCEHRKLETELDLLPLQTGEHSPFALYTLYPHRLDAETVRTQFEAAYDERVDYEDAALLELFACACEYSIDKYKHAIRVKLLKRDLPTLLKNSCSRVTDVIIQHEFAMIPEATQLEHITKTNQAATLDAALAQNSKISPTILVGHYHVKLLTQLENDADHLTEHLQFFVTACEFLISKIAEDGAALKQLNDIIADIIAALVFSDSLKAATAVKQLAQTHLSKLAVFPETTLTKKLNCVGKSSLQCALDSCHYLLAITLYELDATLVEHCEKGMLLKALVALHRYDLIKKFLTEHPDFYIQANLARALLTNIIQLPSETTRDHVLRQVLAKGFDRLLLPFHGATNLYSAEELLAIYLALKDMRKTKDAEKAFIATCNAGLIRTTPEKTSRTLYDIAWSIYQGDKSDHALQSELKNEFRARLQDLQTSLDPDKIATALRDQLQVYRPETIEATEAQTNGLAILCLGAPELAEWIIRLYPHLLNEDRPKNAGKTKYLSPFTVACELNLSFLTNTIAAYAGSFSLTIYAPLRTANISPLYLALKYQLPVPLSAIVTAVNLVIKSSPKDFKGMSLIQAACMADSTFKSSIKSNEREKLTHATNNLLAHIKRIHSAEGALLLTCREFDADSIHFIIKKFFGSICPAAHKHTVFMSLLFDPHLQTFNKVGFEDEDIRTYCNELADAQGITPMQICLNQLTRFILVRNNIRSLQYAQFITDLIKIGVPMDAEQLMEFFQQLHRFSGEAKNIKNQQCRADIAQLLHDMVSTIIRMGHHKKLGRQQGVEFVQTLLTDEYELSNDTASQLELLDSMHQYETLSHTHSLYARSLKDLIRTPPQFETAVLDRLYMDVIKAKHQQKDRGRRVFDFICHDGKCFNTLAMLALLELGFEVPEEMQIVSLCDLATHSMTPPPLGRELLSRLRNRIATHPNELNSSQKDGNAPLFTLIYYGDTDLLNAALDRPELEQPDESIAGIIDIACDNNIPPMIIRKMANKWCTPDAILAGSALGTTRGTSPLWNLSNLCPREAVIAKIQALQIDIQLENYSVLSLIQMLALVRQCLYQGKLPPETAADLSAFEQKISAYFKAKNLSRCNATLFEHEPQIVAALALNKEDFLTSLDGRYVSILFDIAVKLTDATLLSAVLEYIKVTGIKFNFQGKNSLPSLSHDENCFTMIVGAMDRFSAEESTLVGRTMAGFVGHQKISQLVTCITPSTKFVYQHYSKKALSTYIEAAIKDRRFIAAILLAEVLIEKSPLTCVQLLEAQDEGALRNLAETAAEYPSMAPTIFNIQHCSLTDEKYSQTIAGEIDKIKQSTRTLTKEITALLASDTQSLQTPDQISERLQQIEVLLTKLDRLNVKHEFISSAYVAETQTTTDKFKTALTTLKRDLHEKHAAAEAHEKAQAKKGKREAQRRKKEEMQRQEAAAREAERVEKQLQEAAEREAERVEKQLQEAAEREAQEQKQQRLIKDVRGSLTDKLEGIEQALSTLRAEIKDTNACEHYENHNMQIMSLLRKLKALSHYRSKSEGNWPACIAEAMRLGREKIATLEQSLHTLQEQLTPPPSAVASAGLFAPEAAAAAAAQDTAADDAVPAEPEKNITPPGSRRSQEPDGNAAVRELILTPDVAPAQPAAAAAPPTKKAFTPSLGAKEFVPEKKGGYSPRLAAAAARPETVTYLVKLEKLEGADNLFSMRLYNSFYFTFDGAVQTPLTVSAEDLMAGDYHLSITHGLQIKNTLVQPVIDGATFGRLNICKVLNFVPHSVAEIHLGVQSPTHGR
ncbi:MAG: hypothetical protein K0U23_00625 [Gammaproteobacteria bacterium]|nr:hypothetical protein [Gammaproteobacteria bacterium]